MSEGILGNHKSSAAGIYDVYEVPVGKYTKCNISVTSDTTTFNEVVVYVTSDVSVSSKDTIQVDTLKAYRSGYDRTAIILKEGERIVYKTDSSDTHVLVTGVEYDGTAISASDLISSDGNVVIYEAGMSSTATVNLTVSLLGIGSSDRADIDVYITKTDIAAGYKLQKSSLKRDTVSGFERSGFVVSSGDKIIVDATNVVSGVSVRVHGFSRSLN